MDIDIIKIDIVGGILIYSCNLFLLRVFKNCVLIFEEGNYMNFKKCMCFLYFNVIFGKLLCCY